MLRRRTRSSLAALAMALALVAPATAKDDAPMVDSDSPAGTEYQLPIDRAREQAGGAPRGSADGAAGSVPLFGAGVEARGSGSAETPRSTDASGSEKVSPKATASKRPDLGASVPETVRAQAPASDGGGGGGLVAIGGGAAGVLLLGGLAGLAWRRRAGGT